MTSEEANKLNREHAKENGNQLAFPVDETFPFHKGLTKREWMATQLMAGMLAQGIGSDIAAHSAITATNRLLIQLNERR
jgi:hypothetical protein